MGLTLRRNVSWNIIGRGVYAASQWLMLLVLARMGGLDAVGRFALALAVTAPIMLFCNLSLRHVQVTDAAGNYDYEDYVVVRAYTTIVALLVIAGTILMSDYSQETAKVIGLVGLAKAFESMSDIVYGLEQVHHRLDLTARSMMVRGVAGVAATAGGYWFTGGLVGAISAMTVMWGAAYILLDRASERTLLAQRQITHTSTRMVPGGASRQALRLRLVRMSMPMGIVALLISFNANVPRYFIEARLGEAALGAFAAMAYFVVFGSFVVNGLGQAALVDLSTAYATGTQGPFYRLLGRMVAISLVLGAVGVIASGVFGEEILTVLYGAAFARDSEVFMWVMIAGALTYVASVLFYGVTARRIFVGQAVLSAIVVVTQVVACALLVGRYGVLGAVWAWIASLVVQSLLSMVLLAPARVSKRDASDGRPNRSEKADA